MRISHIILTATLLTGCVSQNGPILVEPIPPRTLESQKEDCAIPALFTRSDFDWERNTLVIQPFSMDLYTAESIHNLQKGDRFLFDGDTLIVESVEYDGDFVLINHGLEEDGADLRREEGGYYRGTVWDDYATFTALAPVTLPLSSAWTLSDCGENPSDPSIEVTENHKAYLEALPDYQEQFSPLNTTVELKDGKVISITRRWTP